MNKIIGIILIIAGAYTAYLGINKVAANTEQINFLGIEIDASNESGQTKGYLFIGLGVVLIGGGIFTLNSGRK